MKIPDIPEKALKCFRLGVEIWNLPVAQMNFYPEPHPTHVERIYRHFVKPHPKYKLFKNKQLGVALIELANFASPAAYLDSLRNYGRAATERRRAINWGYTFRTIDRNDHVDEIHEINISSPERQGRAMDSGYKTKQVHFEDLQCFEYFGLFNRDKQLRAYCNLCRLANFAFLDRVIGYKNQDGAMYLLITEIACNLIAEQKLDYLMYDTMFGAQPGLLAFKQRLGFRPYRAKYSCD